MASLLTNLAIRINGKKGAKLTSVKDFIFDWDAETASGTKTQSVEEMKLVFEQIAASGKAAKAEKDKLEERRKHKPLSYNRK